jgi:2-oxoglutarate ferredoxin oxidoreductase subunit delta
MSNRTFKVTVLTQFCKGCGLCVEFCEQGVLQMHTKPNRRGILTAVVRREADCTGCLQCATICPDAALEVARIEGSDSEGQERTVASRRGQAEETDS